MGEGERGVKAPEGYSPVMIWGADGDVDFIVIVR